MKSPKPGLTNRPTRQWPSDMPGVTTAWLARANGVSERTIRWRRANKPTAPAKMREALSAIDAEMGCNMVLSRPPSAPLNYWTRMAIAERAHRGETYAELCKAFGVNKSTVWRCIHRMAKGFQPLSGTRVLTVSQSRLRSLPKHDR
jgi:transposase-like protein